jgi:HSP20 family protein
MKKEDIYRREHEYGSFYRSIPLPDGVKLADITASLANGVLEATVPLPATAEAPARKIEITERATAKAAA